MNLEIMNEPRKKGRWGREEMPGGAVGGTTGESGVNCTRWPPSRVPHTFGARGSSDQQDLKLMNEPNDYGKMNEPSSD